MTINNKIIINCALTGMIPTKELNQSVPLTPQEIAEDVDMAVKLGASIVHVHARDKSGRPTWKKDIYAEIIKRIREKQPNVIITVSTSGRNWSEFEKRAEVLELDDDVKPDMATLTMGSMNFVNTASMNSPEMIEKLATTMQENGIKPEFEIFEPGMIHKANFMLERGMIKDENPYFNIFLGNLGTAPLEVSNVSALLNLLPKNANWAFAGLGRFQLRANVMGLALGGGVRLGLEDNIYFNQEKEALASNQSQIERINKIIDLMDLEISTIEETRVRLGLSLN
ncbi:MAG TPA: 3-keto-5-aminohexanoate cleavage protein [Candidatus Woesebacteria bacterium]|nr:3-keto-5-aminohexanoate cleavage protein [Candidatus Woesebacteria bacterium]